MPTESDRELVARLATPDGHGRAVALLLARHWPAARDYAAVCLAGSPETAQLVATAAAHHVLDRLAAGRGGGALRPQILVTVRDTVHGWAGDGGMSALLPELRKTTGGRGLRAAGGGTPEKRQLAARAFRALPSAGQCLLWHTEVEAEPISVPAGLLGLDAGTAAAALEQAREQFRAGCVRAHRELAPTDECRFHNRLLDIPLRRGGNLLPDVRRHLAECRYCRQTAEQFSHFDGALGLLLAETVLGWGARRYLDSRPGRPQGPVPPLPPLAPASPGGRHRGAAPGRPGASGRHTKAVLVGVGLTTLALLATVLAAQSRSADNAVPGGGTGTALGTGGRPGREPGHTWGAPAGGTMSIVPTPSPTPPSPGVPSAASVERPAPLLQGRLRSAVTGRCLDADAGQVRPGAAVGLADCSPAGSQRWIYGTDGLLRSAADPALCAGADPAGRRVTLTDCADRTVAVAYDLTVRGELLLRRGGGLLLAPAQDAGGAVVVRERDGSAAQRWAFDSGAGEGVTPQRQPAARPDAVTPPAGPGERPRPFRDPGGTRQDPRTRQGPRDRPAPTYTPRYAPADCCARRQPPPPRGPRMAGIQTVTSVLAGAPVGVPRTPLGTPARKGAPPAVRIAPAPALIFGSSPARRG
ncbi:RICIN domain-containing protein [Streptomyces sp. NPDC003395]